MQEIGSRGGCNSSYVKRILQCALLSPKVIEGILSGGQTNRFNLENLRAGIPLDWQEQERKFLHR